MMLRTRLLLLLVVSRVKAAAAAQAGLPEAARVRPLLSHGGDCTDGTCTRPAEDGASLLQHLRREPPGPSSAPTSDGASPYVAVCGNYMGPNYCNGVVDMLESRCFPQEDTDHPFSDRVPPRDCPDACAQQHDYCCHHREGECHDCHLGNWSDDCTSGLERCLLDCRWAWRAMPTIAKLQGDRRATKGRCGECHLDALIAVFRNWSSEGRSCSSVSDLFKNAVQAASLGLNIDLCRKKDNPWPLRFANFHSYAVNISMPPGQKGCAKGMQYFQEINKWRTHWERDYLILPPGETMHLVDNSELARMTDVLWHAEECTFDVRCANTHNSKCDDMSSSPGQPSRDARALLVQLKVSFGRKPPLEAIRHMCHLTRWHRRPEQQAGVVLSTPKAPDGWLGEWDNPGCTVCLCSDAIHCWRHCRRYYKPK